MFLIFFLASTCCGIILHDPNFWEAFWSTQQQRVSLESVSYLAVPLVWTYETPTLPTPPSRYTPEMQGVWNQLSDLYSEMSYGRCQLSFSYFPTFLLSSGIDPTLTQVRSEIVTFLQSRNVSYDRILQLYSRYANGTGPYSKWSGISEINGLYAGMPAPLHAGILNSKIAQSLGHPDHYRSVYPLWRSWNRNETLPTSYFDYYDPCMVGGNLRSLHVSSKVRFGWIPTNATQLMRPEGSSAHCPQCRSELIDFVLTAFDVPALAPNGERFYGIQIPLILANGKLHSYWLSYRAGDEAGFGLSIHHVYESVGYSGRFGGTTDSFSFDVHGDTAAYTDSFLRVGETFVLYPNPLLRSLNGQIDIDVVPVVTVVSLNRYSNITVNVSFRCDAPPPLNVAVQGGCSLSGSTLAVPLPSQLSLLHIPHTGHDGRVNLLVCPLEATGLVSVYWYDRPPVDTRTPAVGAVAYSSFSHLDCCTPGTNVATSGKATAIRITTLIPDFLHLIEVEVFDDLNRNINLNASCFTYLSGYDGNPSCLNDGGKEWYPYNCTSHSAFLYRAGVYDFCIFDQPYHISRIVIYPWYDPAKPWMTDRLRWLNVELFAETRGSELVTDPSNEDRATQMLGLLWSRNVTSISSTNFGPVMLTVAAASTVRCEGTSGTVSFSPIQGEAYALLVPAVPGAGSMSLGYNCLFTKCLANSYLLGTLCLPCPPGTYAPAGSTSSSQCQPCPSTFVSASPFSTKCVADVPRLPWGTSAMAWRVLGLEVQPTWLWDIGELSFFNDSQCRNLLRPGPGLESANAGLSYGTEWLFDGTNRPWGGRPDAEGLFWAGTAFPINTSVLCVGLRLRVTNPTGRILVQVYRNATGWATIASVFGPNVVSNNDTFYISTLSAPSVALPCLSTVVVSPASSDPISSSDATQPTTQSSGSSDSITSSSHLTLHSSTEVPVSSSQFSSNLFSSSTHSGTVASASPSSLSSAIMLPSTCDGEELCPCLGNQCRAGLTCTAQRCTRCLIGTDGCACRLGACDDNLVCQADICLCPVGSLNCPCDSNDKTCDDGLVCTSSNSCALASRASSEGGGATAAIAGGVAGGVLALVLVVVLVIVLLKKGASAAKATEEDNQASSGSDEAISLHSRSSSKSDYLPISSLRETL